jgi:hypothetical protein
MEEEEKKSIGGLPTTINSYRSIYTVIIGISQGRRYRSMV